jgi:thiamine biosynthesis lipoprotein
MWDFHAEGDEAKLPDSDALSEAVSHVGYDKIETDGNKVRITDPETRLDLGGIAKGYIGDRMADLLEERGVTSGIVNLGGNVICIGGKTADDDFVIGVEAPFSDRTEIVGKIGARDMTLVTSGVYERKIEVDGKLYHHILSTKTGYSADTDLDAVTLTAGKGHSMDTDALSTICLIKGHDQARELIENTEGVEAVFILHDGSLDQTSGMKFEPEK